MVTSMDLESNGTRTSGKSPWDKFMYWGNRILETDNLIIAERDTKLQITTRLADARQALLRGDSDWLSAFKIALTKDNNLIAWQTRDSLLSVIEALGPDGEQLLKRVWEPEPSAHLVNELARLRHEQTTGKPNGFTIGEIVNLGSLLLMGSDPTRFPPYRPSPVNKTLDLTKGMKSGPNYSDKYESLLGLCDQVLEFADEANIELADRLDAQSFIWAVTKYEPPATWPDQDQREFRRWRGENLPDEDPRQSVTDRQEPAPSDDEGTNKVTGFDKNTILYGPPGTGKTFSAVTYAVAIVEDKDLSTVRAEPRTAVRERYERYVSENLIAFTTFHQSYGYEEFIEGIRPVLDQDGESPGGLDYELRDGMFKTFCERNVPDDAELASTRNRVFIIDEINRGNISKIFGELITLIEDTKRIGAEDETKAILPYSNSIFGVPADVHVLGTMNTADRSLAVLDTALRRRFSFIEALPEPALLAGVEVEGIEIEALLDTINKRITVLHDREHTIGHAFFIPLRKNPSIEVLANIMQHKVFPLLQEYFYDDYAKIQLVLGDNQKSSEQPEFITAVEDSIELFGSDLPEADVRFEVNIEAFTDPEAYAFLG